MISVAVCTFNGEKYIKKQIESILNQTESVDEIIVVDDGSKDETVSILKKVLGESGVQHQIVENEQNLGVVANFEKAMKLCGGDIVFTCDQDDIWKSDKVQMFMEVFRKQPKASLVFSDGELIDGEDNSMNTTIWTRMNFDARKGFVFEQFLKYNIVTGSAMAVRKETIEQAVPIPSAWLHDGWLALVAYATGNLVVLPEATYYYRIHAQNVVGVGAGTFAGKFENWKKQIRQVPTIYQTKYDRYCPFFKRFSDRLEEMERVHLQDCVEFWGKLLSYVPRNKFVALAGIFKLGMTGKYKKYYTGCRGMLRDILYTLSK